MVPDSTSSSAPVEISGDWQELYLEDSTPDEILTISKYLFTVKGTEVANMPVGTVLGRYSFRDKAGKRNELITLSKPELPAALANRLRERGEVYLLARTYDHRGSWSNMLVIFQQSESCPISYGYQWSGSEVIFVAGLGFSCPWYHLSWDNQYFTGLALNRSYVVDFLVMEDSEPSMIDQVTEFYFPIPEKYLNILLDYIPPR